MVGIHLWVGFNGVTLEEELRFLIREFHIGGIVLFRRNIEGPEQLRSLLRDTQAFARDTLGRPLWVSIDQEGGPVQRLVPPFTTLPAAADLAREGPGAVARWTAVAARELRETGIQVNLAPVLDVVTGGQSHFMEKRSLGSDAETVARLGRVWIETLQQNSICATAKHFPGLGRSESDPHHFAPVIRWRDHAAMERDLLPFREAIRAGVRCVMTSHALYRDIDPQWPATLSPGVNRDILRDRLGFQGILLSDDMDMAAISGHYGWEDAICQGIRASIDVFLLCQHSENIEPFYRCLSDTLRRDHTLAEARAHSLGRIQRFMRYHSLLTDSE